MRHVPTFRAVRAGSYADPLATVCLSSSEEEEPMTAQDRTREILEDLEAVRENLLALSDDIWAGIDRQDLTAFDEGVRFMRSYVEKMTEFDRLAAELSVLIQQYTQVS